jgi:type I restriction-modification system DNA methylase subunit
MSYKNFIDIFTNCLDVLRDAEGLTGEKALRNLSYLMILKLIEPHLGNEIDIDNYEYDFNHVIDEEVETYKTKLLNFVRFSNLTKEHESDTITIINHLWSDILSEHPVTKDVFLKGKGFDICHTKTFDVLIKKINKIDLTNVEYDVLGDVYEEIIKDTMTGKVLGQFFTPLDVKKIMVELVNPKIKKNGTTETIFDPAMGTGGFLITSIKHFIKQSKKHNIALNWDFISNKGIGGNELEPDTFQLAISNMLISSGHVYKNLKRTDSIRNLITEKYDIVLANPPFGISGLKYDSFTFPLKEEYLPIKSGNAVSLFLQLIIYILKINGRCAIVLPNGKELFSKSKSFVKIREYLLKTCDLKKVIHLPSGTFTHTSIKTCIFYFIKKTNDIKTLQTTNVEFYDCGSNTPLTKVPIEKIVNNSYSLDYNEYTQNETLDKYDKDGVVIKTLGEVCDIKIGGTPLRSKIEYYENGNNLWVSVRELNGGYIYDTKEKINDIGVANSNVKLYDVGTILFSFKMSIGKTAIAGKPLYSNEAIAGITPKNPSILYNMYIYHYLRNTNFKHTGSGMIGNGSLNKTSLSKIKIPIPPIEKQKEIIIHFEDVERRKTELERKIEQLKQEIKNIDTKVF